MAKSKLGVIQPLVSFVGVEILTTFWFLIHNFGFRYARKPIKGSKDSDYSLVTKTNLSEKIGQLVWRLGPGKGGKNTPLVTTPQETPKPKSEKKFFSRK